MDYDNAFLTPLENFFDPFHNWLKYQGCCSLTTRTKINKSVMNDSMLTLI
jgi:hypothetical protein